MRFLAPQPARMSPTVLRSGSLRLFFFSREEERPHIHVQGPDGEAKIWVDPVIAVAQNYGLRPRDLYEAIRLVREHEHQIRRAWKEHFER